MRTESIWVRRAQHLSHKPFSLGNELLLILAVSSAGIYQVLLGFLLLSQSAGGNSMASSLSWLNERTANCLMQVFVEKCLPALWFAFFKEAKCSPDFLGGEEWRNLH